MKMEDVVVINGSEEQVVQMEENMKARQAASKVIPGPIPDWLYSNSTGSQSRQDAPVLCD